MSEYTAEQEKLVLRILSHKPHQYYEILGVTKTASDGEIKKSYRKVVVKLHPDKNSHPRASEAFKIFNKAWEVLSDPQKKTIFDQTGSDPTSRFLGHSPSGASASGFNGSFRAPPGFQARGGGGLDEEFFNMFFGGHLPGTTFTFGGGNGFTFQSFGNDPFTRFQQQTRQQRRQQTQPTEPSRTDSLKQLLPLILFLIVTLMASLFSGGDPEYSMTPTREFSVQRTTPRYKVPFYVAPKFASDKSKLKLRKFDRNVENEYIQDKKTMCNREQMRRNQMIDDAQGWFYTDEAMLAKAKELPMPNCNELKHYGII